MIALNTQPIERIEQSGRSSMLDVVDVFDTIQGEGPFAGERAVFVRLAGCNFQCPDCDTDYTSNRAMFRYTDLWNWIEASQGKFSSANDDLFIVLTGGEPLRQNIGPFLSYAFNKRKDKPLHIQIESNGSLYREDIPWFALGLSLVVSPKGGQVHPDLIPHVMAYKYVLEHGKIDPEDGLPTEHLGNPVKVARPPQGWNKTTYIQPADVQDPEANRMNLVACIDSCRRFGYRLSIQLHKFLGVS